MVDKIAIRWAIVEMQMPYFCTEHKREHKYGTKIWEKHLDFIDSDKIVNNVKEIAVLRRKEHNIMIKKVELKHDATMTKNLKDEFEKRKDKPTYFAFEINAYHNQTTFRQVGDRDGYTSLQKMAQDQDIKYKTDNAIRGGSVLIFYKADPFKTIKKQ